MRNRKIFPIKRYHEKLLGLYKRQLQKWRNEIDNWDDRKIRLTEVRIKSVESLIERNEKFYVGF